MKKVLIFIAVALLIITAIPSKARAHQKLTKEEAKNIAADFLQKGVSQDGMLRIKGNISKELTEVKLDESLSDNLFYIFNRGVDAGYVVVASDRRIAEPVVGYSEAGSIDTDNLSPNFRSWLQTMQISLMNYATKATDDKTVCYENPVAPLLKSEWGQDYPYNLMVPIDTFTGMRYPTGCVVTAMTQVMYYHRWPNNGRGSHEYGMNGMQLFADFSKSTYRWDLMLPIYGQDSPKEACDAVAMLMRDGGIAVEAYYGLGGTAATTYGAMYALSEYFDYDKSISYMERNYCSRYDFEQIMINDLRNGRPMMLGGQMSSGNGEGHEFLVDGFDDNGFYHINFGWDGGDNGYYKMGAFGWDLNLEIIYNIKKNEGGAYALNLGCKSDFIYENDVLSGTIFMYNMGNNEIYRALAIENVNTKTVIYDVQQGVQKNRFHITSSLEDGDYIVYPVASMDIDPTWRKFYFYDNRQTFVDLKVKDGKFTFENNHLYNGMDEGKVEIDNMFFILDEKNLTATLTARNDRGDSYSGEVVVPSNVSYDGKTYTVTAIGASACENNKYLRSMEIPATIERIEYAAFSQCPIESIIIPQDSKLNYVGGWAFNGTYITNLNLPEGFVETSMCAFQSCNFLKKISLPSTFKNIGPATFADCTNIEEIRVAWPMPPTDFDLFESIPDKSKCKLIVPKGTKENYEASVYWNGFNIVEDPTFEAPVISVSEIVLDKTNITFEIGSYEYCFLYATIIPDNATTKGIAWTSSDEDVVVVTSHGMAVAKGSGKATITAMATDGSGISAICTVRVIGSIEEEQVVINDIKYYTFDEKNLTATLAYCDVHEISSKDLVVPSTVTCDGKTYTVSAIGESVCEKNMDLRSMEIPATVERIEYAAFSQCLIESIIIPQDSKLNYVGGWAFNGTRITNLNLPEGFVETSMCAFQSCNSLKKISLPSTFKNIGPATFADCKNIEEIRAAWPMPPTDFDLFESIPDKSKCKLIVPKGSKENYEASVYWNGFNIIEEVGPDPNEIDNITIDNDQVVTIYTLDGKRVEKIVPGKTYIMLGKDGKAKKIEQMAH